MCANVIWTVCMRLALNTETWSTWLARYATGSTAGLASLVCKQGFLDSALVVGSFHVIDRVGEEGLERAVRALQAETSCITASSGFKT